MIVQLIECVADRFQKRFWKEGKKILEIVSLPFKLELEISSRLKQLTVCTLSSLFSVYPEEISPLFTENLWLELGIKDWILDNEYESDDLESLLAVLESNSSQEGVGEIFSRLCEAYNRKIGREK